MPNCFQLFPIGSTEPESLSVVDERICNEVLHTEVHPRFYGGNCFNWFDTIGFNIAMGKTLSDGENSVRNYYKNNEMWKEEFPIIEKIINFLQENYTAKNWYSVHH